MYSAYRQAVSFATALAITFGTLGSGSAIARTLKDHKPHHGVKRAHSMSIQGIDVSYYQGDIDWQQVRQAGRKGACEPLPVDDHYGLRAA